MLLSVACLEFLVVSNWSKKNVWGDVLGKEAIVFCGLQEQNSLIINKQLIKL